MMSLYWVVGARELSMEAFWLEGFIFEELLTNRSQVRHILDILWNGLGWDCMQICIYIFILMDIDKWYWQEGTRVWIEISKNTNIICLGKTQYIIYGEYINPENQNHRKSRYLRVKILSFFFLSLWRTANKTRMRFIFFRNPRESVEKYIFSDLKTSERTSLTESDLPIWFRIATTLPSISEELLTRRPFSTICSSLSRQESFNRLSSLRRWS